MISMITGLIWTIWTSLSVVPRKSVKCNHSLTHWQMISYNLQHNDFVFNDQTSITAMGKKYASSFANIFMANMVEEVLSKVM